MDKKDKLVYKLKNGIKVLIIPMDTKLTYLSVSMLLGSKHENKNNIEVTHFLEHLMGQYTSKKYQDAEYINKELSKRGAIKNAYVDTYETNFYVSGFWKDLEFFIDLLSNVMSDFHLDKDIAKTEKLAVIQERKNFISDNHYVFNYKINNFLFPKYAYHFDLKKHIELIKSYNVNKIYDFYKKHIQLNNVTVSITCPKAGLKETQRLVNRYFGILRNIRKTKLKYPLYEYKSKQLKMVYIKKPYKDVNVTLRLYTYKRIEFLSKEHLCLVFLSELLFNFDIGIFYKRLRKELGIVYYVGIYIDIDIKEPRSSNYYIDTTAEQSNVPRLIKELLNIFRTYSLTDEEIEDAKNIVYKNFEYRRFFNLTSYNNYYSTYTLYNKPIIERSELLKKYQQISNRDIRKYFEIMKKDILSRGTIFYYAQNNLNTKIKAELAELPNSISFKLQSI